MREAKKPIPIRPHAPAGGSTRKTGDFGLAVAALRQALLVTGTRDGHLISLAQGISPGQIVRTLVERSLPVYDIAPAQETIEDFYLSLMNGRRGLE
jgi:hypothetical protein